MNTQSKRFHSQKFSLSSFNFGELIMTTKQETRKKCFQVFFLVSFVIFIRFRRSRLFSHPDEVKKKKGDFSPFAMFLIKRGSFHHHHHPLLSSCFFPFHGRVMQLTYSKRKLTVQRNFVSFGLIRIALHFAHKGHVTWGGRGRYVFRVRYSTLYTYAHANHLSQRKCIIRTTSRSS